jgi:hypothetical protein
LQNGELPPRPVPMRILQIILQPAPMIAPWVAPNCTPTAGGAAGKTCAVDHAVLHGGGPDAADIASLGGAVVVDPADAQEGLG